VKSFKKRDKAMSEKKKNYSRREFFKATCAAGLTSTLLPMAALKTSDANATGNQELRKVPTRPFGKTGIDVSILSLGGVLGMSDQLMFRQAMKMGVTYWDTADSYGWGKNEKAIGKYFEKYPQDRSKVFLVTKAASSNPEKLSEKLETSLQRMNTNHIDLYFIHYVDNVADELTDEVQDWVEKAKAEGKIRLFGFSTHKKMEATMLAAAKLGWIDGIMMSYNYRLMVKPEMKRAVKACVEAGIGLTAMKTQAAFSANFYASIGSETDDAIKMTKHFLSKGYTAEQARLKVVWENPHIASICSAMPNMAILQANVAAALDKTGLSANDHQRLNQYARMTAPGYCTGCAHICEPSLDTEIPISDVMRYLMYAHAYKDLESAKRGLLSLPENTRKGLLEVDYSRAEKRCPQKMPIARIMRQATKLC
jgi:predicted aldo/keto reductase-like oxidoreductase